MEESADEKNVRRGKRMTECTKSATMLDGKYRIMLILYKELEKHVRYLPHYPRSSIYDLVMALEEAKQEVKIGEDRMSGLMFADDAVGISGTTGLREK